MSRPRRENYSRKSYDPRRAFGSANYLTAVTGGGLTLPRAGLIFYAKAPGMVDTIGLSANALWAALPATHRSVYLVDENTLRSVEDIITNIEASEYLNDGATMVASIARGVYCQYADGTVYSVIDRAFRVLGLYPILRINSIPLTVGGEHIYLGA